MLLFSYTQTPIEAIAPGFYVATTERPDLADMRQITGQVSSVPILIYTIDNSVPVNTITDDTVVFKLPMDVSSLGLSCTASTSLLSAVGKHMLNDGFDYMQPL